MGFRCTYAEGERDWVGQELSDGARGHASGGSVRGAGQTKQRGCGASDGLSARQTGRDTMSTAIRTALALESGNSELIGDIEQLTQEIGQD